MVRGATPPDIKPPKVKKPGRPKRGPGRPKKPAWKKHWEAWEEWTDSRHKEQKQFHTKVPRAGLPATTKTVQFPGGKSLDIKVTKPEPEAPK